MGETGLQQKRTHVALIQGGDNVECRLGERTAPSGVPTEGQPDATGSPGKA